MRAGSVLLVGARDDSLAGLIEEGLKIAGGEDLRHAVSEQDALALLRDGEEFEALCVAPGVAEPLKLVQHAHAIDRDLAALVIAERERHATLEQERLFTPFLGPDVSCRSTEEAQILGAELSDAAARTRERRSHRATLEALAEQPGVVAAPRPLAGRHFNTLLDRAPVGAVTLDRDGRIRGWNGRAEQLLQSDLRSTATSLTDLFGAADRDRLRRILEPSASRMNPVTANLFERRLPNGDMQFLEVSAGDLPDAETPGEETIVVLQDVTARVRAEQRQQRLERELDASRRLLEAVVGGAADAVFIKDREGRYLLINQAGAAALRRAVGEVVGRTDAELLSAAAARRIREDDIGVMAGSEPQTFEEEVGEGVTFLSTKVPYFDEDGNVAGVLGTARDITDRKREEHRTGFLNRAAGALTSLDADELVRAVAELAVPDVADLCVIAVPPPDERITTPLFTARAAGAAAWEEQSLVEGELWASVGAEVIRTNRSLLHERTEPAAAAGPGGAGRVGELLERLGLRSLMGVPLPAAGRPMGAMVLGRSRSPAFGERDLRLAEELARRAAVSIENARVHTERSRVAMILQESLLPPTLAQIPGAHLAVRFHAAGRGVEVGGDFYDAFDVEDGIALLIGDVCGKGPGAAAVTALARYTIRAIAMHEPRPDRILLQLNEALLRQRESGDFCTAALIRVTARGDGRLELEATSGGHPLPIILRGDGSGGELGFPGTLLGAVPAPRLSTVRALLEPGDACVLYTDGLNEALAPRLLSPDNLLALLRPAAGHGAAAIADRLDVVPTTAGEAMRDDTAIVVISVPPAPG